MTEQQDEKVFDEEEWKNEAKAVIRDVEECVKEIVISDKIPSTNSSIYCNLTTVEEEKYCIELTASGFRIVGKAYNDCSEPTEDYFETPYSLLDTISPGYRVKFSSSLASKLLDIAKLQENSSSVDYSEN
ncbi:UNVERIFIED_CONTAM: hypothetical protein RMT77_015630 [Armadillidium vulgare]